MSLSKINPGSSLLRIPPRSSQSGLLQEITSWPKWQLALLFGAPVVLFGFGYFLWFRQPRQRSKPPPTTRDEGSGDGQLTPEAKNKTFAKEVKSSSSVNSNSENVKPVVSKPKYLELKESGNELFKIQKYEEALEYYTKGINDFTPEDPLELANLYQNRAAVFEKLGNYLEVIKECTKALEYNKLYVKAFHRRANAYRRTGFIDNALEDITAVCIIEKFSQGTSIQKADEYLREFGVNEAKRLMSIKEPSLPSTHTIVSFLRSYYNDPITKLWDGRTNLEEDENNENGFLKAVKELKENNFENIIEYCTNEINKADTKYLIESHHLRGTIRYQCGYREETLADFDFVINSQIASREDKAGALIKKAGYYSLIEDEGGFIEAFELANVIYPDNTDFYHHRGQILLTKGETERSLEDLIKASALCPDFALTVASRWYVNYRLAAMMGNQSEMQDAMKNFSKCVRKYPNSVDVHNLYGQLLIEGRRFEEADGYFKNCLEIDPNNVSVMVHRVMSKFQQDNNVENAVEALRKISKVDPKNEFVYETLGTMELQVGELKNSIETMGKALQLSRSFQEVMMISSLKKAAEVQTKVKEKYGLDIPSINSLPQASGF